MTERFEESPMLEIAHERQFVISQIGGCSNGFEVEHTRRISECLSALDSHFRRFTTDELCPPSPSENADLCACWRPDTSLDTLPPLLISADLTFDTYPTTPKQNSKPSSLKSVSSPRQEPGLLVGPAPLDVADEEVSDEMEAQLKQKLLFLPRARTTVSNNGSRSQKTIRLRRKYDSKLTSESAPSGMKRRSDCIVDKHEDAATVALRSRSIASLRTTHRGFGCESASNYLSRREET